MADQVEYDWSEVPVPAESVTEVDQLASNNISLDKPVGTFLCVISKSIAVQRHLHAYSCIAAQLDMTVERVLRIEQPLVDNEDNPIKRDGEIVMKSMPVPADKLKEVESLFVGVSITEQINLFHPEEKTGTKNRRLYCGKQIGIFSEAIGEIPPQVWAQAAGKKIIITTERQSYKDKMTDEVKHIVKVAWDGFESAEKFMGKYVQNAAPDVNGSGYSDGMEPDLSANANSNTNSYHSRAGTTEPDDIKKKFNI
jgi:hypothetical protein